GQNTQIYLLDRYLKPVPVGVHGELFIAGYCLSNGYLFNEALTNERFIDNPYDPGTKMYTTGDIGKRLKDGNIDFVGRADSQIKINGYRIEPREIECELLDYDLLDEVVVCLSQSRISSEKYLSCYFVAKTRVNESELRQFLSERLPRYMI